MSEQPTQPLDESLISEARWYQRPLSAVRFWEDREMPPMLAQWWRSATGPWGRFYTCIGLALALVYRPTSWAALVGIGLVTLISTLGRYHWLWYAVPVAAVAAKIGPEVGVPLSIGLLFAGHRWTTRASRPDALAERLHLRIAKKTGAPTHEEFWRYETFSEAHDRIGAYPPIRGARRKASNPARRIRKKDHRPLNPVPHWLRIDRASPVAVAEGAYEIVGLFFHYSADCPDDDPDWRQGILDAIASKLPPMRIPGSTELVPPSLIAPATVGPDADDREPGWRTSKDWVYAVVARPIPAWCTLADLPELPWDGVVPVGLTSPDYPVGTVVEGVAVAVWNLYSDACPVPPEAHAMVVGPTGSYKTTAVRTLVHGLRELLDAEIWAIDGKGEGAFAYLDGREGCQETRDPVQGKAYVLDAYREMELRYDVNDVCRRAGQPLVRFRPIVLVIDEGMSWLDQLEADPAVNDLVFWLADISRRGRTARISIIWSTQRPDVRNVQGKGTVGQMRDNLGFRLAGAGITEIGARMIYGDSNGALATRIPKRPRARMGLMIGQDASQFGIIQLAYTPDPLAKDADADGFPGPYAARARDLADNPNIPLFEVVQAAEHEAHDPDDDPPSPDDDPPRNRLRMVTP